MRNAYKISVGKSGEVIWILRHVEGGIAVKFTAVRLGVRMCGSGYGPMATCFGLRYESRCSIKSGAVYRASERLRTS